MPDVSIETVNAAVRLSDLPNCCARCDGAVAGSQSFTLTTVVQDVDGAFRSLAQIAGGVGVPGIRRLSEDKNLEIVAEKTVEIPLCSKHLVDDESWWRASLLVFGPLIAAVAWAGGWWWVAVSVGQPLLFLVGMAPLFWFAVKASQGGFMTKDFGVQLLDAKRVVFRNAAPQFASELSKAEWKRQFGDEAPPLEGARKPHSDNPFA